jgi:hypothetical protein
MANCSRFQFVSNNASWRSIRSFRCGNCTGGILSIDPAAIDVAKLSSDWSHSPQLLLLSPIPGRHLIPTPRMHCRSQKQTWTRVGQATASKRSARLRHPRNICGTTHERTSAAARCRGLEANESLAMRGWRVVRELVGRVPDCTPIERRLAKSGGQGGGVSAETPARPQLACRESHLF